MYSRQNLLCKDCRFTLVDPCLQRIGGCFAFEEEEEGLPGKIMEVLQDLPHHHAASSHHIIPHIHRVPLRVRGAMAPLLQQLLHCHSTLKLPCTEVASEGAREGGRKRGIPGVDLKSMYSFISVRACRD